MASILTILGPLSWLSSILVWWRLRKWNVILRSMWDMRPSEAEHFFSRPTTPYLTHEIYQACLNMWQRNLKPRKEICRRSSWKKISPAVFNKDVSLGKKKGWRRVSYDYHHGEFYWLMTMIAMKSSVPYTNSIPYTSWWWTSPWRVLRALERRKSGEPASR